MPNLQNQSLAESGKIVTTGDTGVVTSAMLDSSITISNNLTVTGDLTVSGNTTTLNTANLNVEDSFILLNSGVTGSPTLDSGLEVERGTSTNVFIRWNETTDKWQFTNDGSTYNDFGAGGATNSLTAPASPVAGSLWFKTDTAQTFVYYVDGTSNQWVEIGASGMAAMVSDNAPSSPIAGQIWFNSLNGGTYVYYSSAWTEIGAVPAGVPINVIDAKGDLIVGTADNTAGRLGVGTNGFSLKANSSTATGLEWALVPSISILDDVGDVTITSATNGDLLKWNGTAWVNAAGYALLASPTFTGTPTLPTGTIATTQSVADNSTKVATTAFVRGEVTALVNSATATLDTLGEIATALGNDANLSTTLTTSIGLKAPLASPTFTGTVVLPATTSIGTVTNTEIGYVDGVTSAIQTQLDAKVAKTTLTTTGDILYASAANTPARLAIGSSTNVLTVSSGIPAWSPFVGASSLSGVIASFNQERNASVAAGNKWANGNGSADTYIIFPFACKLVAATISASTDINGTAVARPWLNAAVVGVSTYDITVSIASPVVSYDFYASPLAIPANQRFAWHCQSSTLTVGTTAITFYVRFD